MALDTSKCNPVMTLGFEGLKPLCFLCAVPSLLDFSQLTTCVSLDWKKSKSLEFNVLPRRCRGIIDRM